MSSPYCKGFPARYRATTLAECQGDGWMAHYRDVSQLIHGGGIAVLVGQPGTKSMASSFHALRGAIEAMGGVFIAVPVREWQRAMLGKTRWDSKPLALAAAKTIWPEEQWLATPRCKVAHDGMVDAALIAEYTRHQ